jgi:Fur family transcriptional regulator, peroxide stress response regulator
MTDETVKNMLQALKTAGYRITPQRRAICRILAGRDDHPSAQMLFEQLQKEYDSPSLATIYNTLDALSRLGVINVLGEVGSSGDAIRYDADTGPHANLACVRCQRIIDVHNEHVQALDRAIEHDSGYALLGARVLYYGICPDCQKKEQGMI